MAISTLLAALAIDFGLNCLAGLHAVWIKSERYYDITGATTHALSVLFTYFAASGHALRQQVVTAMITVWAIRLGVFLGHRIHKAGVDKRFNNVRENPPLFFVFWIVQALWCFLIGLPVHIINSSEPAAVKITWNLLDLVGVFLFCSGFVIETISDYQKSAFRSIPANKDKFIKHGLWSISRHPNYLGEIVLHCGVVLTCVSGFSKAWHYLSFLSPLFTAYLLLKISGVPPLEESADKKWQNNEEYKQYKKRTPVLVPFIGSTQRS